VIFSGFLRGWALAAAIILPFSTPALAGYSANPVTGGGSVAGTVRARVKLATKGGFTP
jgi:hypothetical protein